MGRSNVFKSIALFDYNLEGYLPARSKATALAMGTTGTPKHTVIDLSVDDDPSIDCEGGPALKRRRLAASRCIGSQGDIHLRDRRTPRLSAGIGYTKTKLCSQEANGWEL